MHVIKMHQVEEDVLSDVIARDAVLWLTDADIEGDELTSIVSLIESTWKAVFVESSSRRLADLITSDGNEAVASSFTHLIAGDPTGVVLPQRSRPVFFLNGIEGGEGKESASLSGNPALRRRLNMLARLTDLEPRRLVVLGANPVAAIKEIADLWQTEFRALLAVVSNNDSLAPEVSAVLQEATALSSLAWINQTASGFSKVLSERLSHLVDSEKIVVSIRLPSGRVEEVDLRKAEQIEYPISAHCELITVKDTFTVSPQDLSEAEFKGFFTKNEISWRPYAAQLPWVFDRTAEQKFIRSLNNQLNEFDSSLKLFSIVSEPGAGGTTCARRLAFAAAKEGFPTLLVKQQAELPSALELTNFLYRAVGLLDGKSDVHSSEFEGEPVWVIVLDVQHAGRGFDEMERVYVDLTRSGRKIALLKVVSSNDELALPEIIEPNELAHITHDVEKEQVEQLGRHLNSYLRNFGRAKSSDEWLRFWNDHKPDMDTGFASFWIALEFWLTGYLALGESIQGWVLKQFNDLPTSVDAKRAILEVAAFAIERKPLPERLFGALNTPSLPWSLVMEENRKHSPGIGLVQSQDSPFGRVWSIGHDVLARYLINGISYDRPALAELGLGGAVDSVDLRLNLIERVTSRPSFGEPFAGEFARQLATRVLKLEEKQGNPEYFPYWRKVLKILESVPDTIKISSRAFRHHVAISRRRVTQEDLFDVEVQERIELLQKSVVDLEFALEHIEQTYGDEGDLALLNTLALVYQDLAEQSSVGGLSDEIIAGYLLKADEVTNNALKQNQNNRYVLETAAKNLLRQRNRTADELSRVEAAAKALTFVFQASRLESATIRRSSLSSLASEAIQALRGEAAQAVIERMCSLNSPYGYLAKAWTKIPQAKREGVFVLGDLDIRTAEEALAILKSSPVRDLLIVKLQYELEVIVNPQDFLSQLNLLDEIAAGGEQSLSLQHYVERAVLLYMQGQHKAADKEFKRLRPKVKDAQNPVYVPIRLRWLLRPDKSKRAICSARMADSNSSARLVAKVRELSNVEVLFNAQEFSRSRMGVGEQFKCQVTFSAMGPFLKPVDQDA
ncbi:hypothetical protein [Pseudomonas chlororaphis]|uniref:hypothetical protein n=1 Tax=Pseudomonas chlororaphis TaxID=587753 RepID=UPI000B0F644A|nr:hypothetical protein [Pseudomonas chlororaphis]AZD30740.1 hypothetical protein C4K23_3999 [Pseudomonas chlororaphis]QFS56097.1 hypothetical protein FD951_16665 [Pseudomonas chlororaphis subsp. aurantiaca]